MTHRTRRGIHSASARYVLVTAGSAPRQKPPRSSGPGARECGRSRNAFARPKPNRAAPCCAEYVASRQAPRRTMIRRSTGRIASQTVFSHGMCWSPRDLRRVRSDMPPRQNMLLEQRRRARVAPPFDKRPRVPKVRPRGNLLHQVQREKRRLKQNRQCARCTAARILLPHHMFLSPRESFVFHCL